VAVASAGPYASLHLDNHASTPPVSFLQAGCPSCHPTNSVKALKALNDIKQSTQKLTSLIILENPDRREHDKFHVARAVEQWHQSVVQINITLGNNTICCYLFSDCVDITAYQQITR